MPPIQRFLRLLWWTVRVWFYFDTAPVYCSIDGQSSGMSLLEEERNGEELVNNFILFAGGLICIRGITSSAFPFHDFIAQHSESD